MSLSEALVPLLYALFGWWSMTALILFLNHLPRHTYRWSLTVASLVFVASLYLLQAASRDVSGTGVLLSFAAGLLVWGWLEMTYLMGWITGPCQRACPEGCSGWTRFRLAVGTSVYHELTVLLTVGLALYLTAGAPNQVGSGTLVILWLMRWSAKLNLYLGMPGINVDWFPPHLRYLSSYIRQRSMNWLFPLSISAGTATAAFLWEAATVAELPAQRAGSVLLCGLLSLAILEHWFMVLPIRDSALWDWAMRAGARVSRRRAALAERRLAMRQSG
jgi:putative photosynthetic complex assembly protein 2